MVAGPPSCFTICQFAGARESAVSEGFAEPSVGKSSWSGDISVCLAVKPAARIGDRGARRTHEQRPRLMVRGAHPILPEPAAVGVGLRSQRLPLVGCSIPI